MLLIKTLKLKSDDAILIALISIFKFQFNFRLESRGTPIMENLFAFNNSAVKQRTLILNPKRDLNFR